MSNTMQKIEGGSATTAEALKVLGLDFESKKGRVYDHNMQVIEGKSTIYREDTQSVLGLNSDKYEHMAYSEAFEVFDKVLGPDQAQITGGASLRGGAGAFIQMKLPESAEVLKGDQMDLYLNGFASHDGSLSLGYSYGAERLACSNQIMGTWKRDRVKVRSVSIRHSKNMRDKMDLAHRVLTEGAQCLEALRENAQILARKSVGREQTKRFIETLFPMKEDAKKDRNKANKAKVEELVEVGRGTDIVGVKGTSWGLYNAATEWFDHHARVQDRGIRSVVKGANFRDKAMNLAMSV